MSDVQDNPLEPEDTPGEAPLSRSKLPLIVGGIVALVVILVAGSFVWRAIKNKKDRKPTAAELAAAFDNTPPPKVFSLDSIKQNLTSKQTQLGEPIQNSVGMVLVPIPAGEFTMGTDRRDRRFTQMETQRQKDMAEQKMNFKVYCLR